jgi:hypothetical protein
MNSGGLRAYQSARRHSRSRSAITVRDLSMVDGHSWGKAGRRDCGVQPAVLSESAGSIPRDVMFASWRSEPGESARDGGHRLGAAVRSRPQPGRVHPVESSQRRRAVCARRRLGGHDAGTDEGGVPGRRPLHVLGAWIRARRRRRCQRATGRAGGTGLANVAAGIVGLIWTFFSW